MKDARGHGSNTRGGKVSWSKDPLKRARQLEHIRNSMAAQKATSRQLELADEHGIDVAHLRSVYDAKAADDFADALKQYPGNNSRSVDWEQIGEKPRINLK